MKGENQNGSEFSRTETKLIHLANGSATIEVSTDGDPDDFLPTQFRPGAAVKIVQNNELHDGIVVKKTVAHYGEQDQLDHAWWYRLYYVILKDDPDRVVYVYSEAELLRYNHMLPPQYQIVRYMTAPIPVTKQGNPDPVAAFFGVN